MNKAAQMGNVELSKFSTQAGIVPTYGVILFGNILRLPCDDCLSCVSLLFIGISIVSGGSFNYWNGGLKSGYYDFLAITIFTIVGFLCMILCLAEMASTLPFSGGLYGFVRACLGPFWGYVIGILEIIQNILKMTFLSLSLGHIFGNLIDTSISISNLFSMGFLFLAILGNMTNGKSYWYSQYCVSILVLIIVIAYIIISGTTSNIPDEIHLAQRAIFDNTSPTQHFHSFMKAFPFASFFFIGIEMIPVCSNDTISVSSFCSFS